MTIYINGRFLTQKTSGVQRFAREIVCALDRRLSDGGKGVDMHLLTPQGGDRLPLSAIAQSSVGPLSGHVWEQTSLFAAARAGALLNLCNSGPVLHRRSLTVIHDAMIFRTPENFSWKYRLVHQTLGHLLARRSKIATVSSFSKGELQEVIGARDVAIIANSCDHMATIPADDSVLTRHGLDAQAYLLFVGSPTPNKNIARAIEAIDSMGETAPYFVVVGAAASSVFQAPTAGEGAPARPQADRVIFTGRLSDGEIVSLYRHAGALLFPSLYEGFGIPPLEAMVLGCPVLSSDIVPTREVCGDAALYFDPLQPQAMVQAIGTVMGDAGLRQEMIDRGRRRAGQFSWDRSAADLLAALAPL